MDRILNPIESLIADQKVEWSNKPEIEQVDKVVTTEWDLPKGVTMVRKYVQVADPNKYEFKLLEKPVPPKTTSPLQKLLLKLKGEKSQGKNPGKSRKSG